MLDLAGLVISTVLMLLVLTRAIAMDSTLPWFAKPNQAAPREPGGQAITRQGRPTVPWRERGVAADARRRRP